MNNNSTIWFDFTNVPHVSFLHPIIKHFDNYKQIYSVRDFAETKHLFENKISNEYILSGKHKGKSKIKKIAGSIGRTISLLHRIPKFDVKISVGGDSSSITAKLRGKKSITFDDNEKAPNWRYSRFSDLAFWPDVISVKTLEKQGFKKEKTFQYNGFKEDFYIADFTPDESFLDQIPFKNYIVIRPENIQANYVDGNKSIVPELIKQLTQKGYNIVFLPRYEHDKEYAKAYSNVFIPPQPLNGLDVCYYSDFVLTGAGTMAREAACLGIPAISFYTGKDLLTVDQAMIDKGLMFFSRDISEIVLKMQDFPKSNPDLSRSQKVKQQILEKLEEFLNA